MSMPLYDWCNLYLKQKRYFSYKKGNPIEKLYNIILHIYHQSSDRVVIRQQQPYVYGFHLHYMYCRTLFDSVF